MDQVNGKVVVVTGGSTGIGAAITVSLAKRGLTVVGIPRNDVKVLAMAVTSKGNIHSLKCDLSNEDEIIKAFQWIENNLGGVDILINNADILEHSTLIDGNSDDWKKIIDTNIIALSICTRESIKNMRKRGDIGQIIQLNSITGPKISTISGIGMYSASKSAVTVLSDTLRNELKQLDSGIRITVLSPASHIADTERKCMMKNLGKKFEDNDHIPEIKPGHLTPENIAETIIGVLSLSTNVEIIELTVKSVN